MALIGRLHPLILHFPIALVIVAAVAEVVAILTNHRVWHAVAVANTRAGAVFAVPAAITGWLLSASTLVDDVRVLEWHRWMGTAATVAILGAALATAGTTRQSLTLRCPYRIALVWAAALVGVAGHLGARLVWGADFVRP